MAKYIDRDTLRVNGKTVSPAEFGYIIIPLYGLETQEFNHRKMVNNWIEKNIIGYWTTFGFGVPKEGQSYGFLNEKDAMAFKLRWS